MSIYIGTAAWSLPKVFQNLFPAEGTHLERYSQVLNAVEINSSFYRDHQAKSYRRWAENVPENFRFSVKLSKEFTHVQKLNKGDKDLSESLKDIQALGDRLGCLLVQIPPSLSFDRKNALQFFSSLRKDFLKPVAFEPRHISWCREDALGILQDFQISRVLADPEAQAWNPFYQETEQEIFYYRLHGSPDMYKSNYDKMRLQRYAREIQELSSRADVWCVFDNTTYGFATLNAWMLSRFVAVQGISENRSREIHQDSVCRSGNGHRH